MFVFAMFMLTGCGWLPDRIEETEDQKTYHIAVLGAEDYVFGDEGFTRGLELAISEAADRNVSVQWEYYDDGGDYEQGLVLAQQLAADDAVEAVLSFQDFEMIDAQMPYFEEAGKVLIAVTGCYESTLEQGYHYLFSSYISPGDMGESMAEYCAQLGCTRVACAHTNTVYEIEEALGFCRRAAELGISIVDMTQEVDNRNELKVTWRKWKQMDVEAMYTCCYIDNMQEKEWLFQTIRYLREQQDSFVVLGDYSLKLPDTLGKYRKYLNGIVYPQPYPVGSSNVSAQFEKTYQALYPDQEVPPSAYQGYDLANMLIKAMTQKISSSTLADYLKSKNGYEGVSGTIYYDSIGKLKISNDISNWYLYTEGRE